MPLFPTDRRVVQQTSSTTPDNALGVDGDFLLIARDGGATSSSSARLTGPKANGGWPDLIRPTVGVSNEAAHIPIRSLTMESADLLPGWRLPFAGVWCTGAVPADLTRTGTFGGTSFQANVSGTRAFISRCRTNLKPTAGMAFFSAVIQITTRPEASRFAHVGQFTDSGGSPYGYGARIDSSGNVTLRSIDSFIAGDVQLASGLTVANGDWLIIERFGYTLSASKILSGTRQILGAENATATNRPIRARVGDNTADVYAPQFSACSFGYFTDSTAVRIGTLEFAG